MRIPDERAPIYEMLEQHAGGHPYSFHVPGHKQRAQWGHEAADRRYAPLLPLDLTELSDTDDLHHPAGPIYEAQRLAAHCFGAEETLFLVGGSTAGNLGMILGVTQPGDLLIVQRNVHRSVIHGLMLAGIRAVLLQPRIDPHSGLAVIPEAGLIGEAVSRYPEAKGVLIGSPNYYGMSGDLKPVADLCHEAGVPLLVDEAHGPHFGFHPAFPRSALQAGADVVVQSAHKMLGAMTMGAMLHMQGSRINRASIRQALRMVQSSSPSFPLLASLDLARRQVHSHGEAAFEPALHAVRTVWAQLPDTGFRVLGQGGSGSFRAGSQDPFKLVLFDESGIFDGFRIRDELAVRGCVAEMADSRFAVLAFGIGSRKEDGEALAAALRDMTLSLSLPSAASAQAALSKRPAITAQAEDKIMVPEPVHFHREFRDSEPVRLEESVGRTAGEWIVPYPPGIPELFPGERITLSALDRLKSWRKQGALIQGAADPTLAFVSVWSF